MVIIGVGYLFPMAAIWAAFDYWKMLFPDRNVEFAVTAWYQAMISMLCKAFQCFCKDVLKGARGCAIENQVGSFVTVVALSFQESFDFGPRILGGFAGQFLCLSVPQLSKQLQKRLSEAFQRPSEVIFIFHWLSASLYQLLLAVVLLCSVATGYLDSALLSLCSQYSSKMQSYLQIGLGFGPLPPLRSLST